MFLQSKSNCDETEVARTVAIEISEFLRLWILTGFKQIKLKMTDPIGLIKLQDLILFVF